MFPPYLPLSHTVAAETISTLDKLPNRREAAERSLYSCSLGHDRNGPVAEVTRSSSPSVPNCRLYLALFLLTGSLQRGPKRQRRQGRCGKTLQKGKQRERGVRWKKRDYILCRKLDLNSAAKSLYFAIQRHGRLQVLWQLWLNIKIEIFF